MILPDALLEMFQYLDKPDYTEHHNERSTTMNATLTLKKSDLLQKLDARRKEINDFFDVEVDKIESIITARDAAVSDSEALADWHSQVAAGLSDGSILISSGGKLRGAPAKPGTAAYDGPSVPKDSELRKSHYWNYPKNQLEGIRDRTNKDRNSFLKEIDTSKDLILMSTNETVEINTADYQKMLSSDLRGRYSYGY